MWFSFEFLSIFALALTRRMTYLRNTVITIYIDHSFKAPVYVSMSESGFLVCICIRLCVRFAFRLLCLSQVFVFVSLSAFVSVVVSTILSLCCVCVCVCVGRDGGWVGE